MTEAKNQRTSGVTNPAEWLLNAIGGGSSDSGIRLNGYTALELATCWQAINILAKDVAKLPFEVFRETESGSRERDRRHPAYRLLKRMPNSYMTAFTFRATMTAHAMMWGDAVALILRDRAGSPTELIPVLPDYAQVYMDENGAKWCAYKTPVYGTQSYPLGDRSVETEWRAVPYSEFIQISNLSPNGVAGYCLWAIAKNSIGRGLAIEKHSNRLFANGAVPRTVLKHPARLSEQDANALRNQWNATHAGTENAGGTAVLQGGMDVATLSSSATDAQLIQQEQFIRQNVASWFNIPPHKLGDTSRTSYSSLEQENRAYLTHSLEHWLCAWEQECDIKLLTARQRQAWSHYTEFNRNAMLLGDTVSRYQAYEIGRRNEWLSANDVRRAENMPLIEDPTADMYINPNRSPSNQPGAESTVETDSVEEAPSDEVQALLTHKLAQFEALVRQRVKHIAHNSSDFCNALDATIGTIRSKMEADLIPTAKLAGVNPQAIWDRLGQVHQASLEAAGYSTSETLPEHVGHAVRAVQFVDIGSDKDLITL